MSSASRRPGPSFAIYLRRKLRERGWEGDGEPDLDGDRRALRRAGYVDDAAFALTKARSLTGRGYGKRRLVQKLRVAGVDEARRRGRAGACR